MSIVTPSFNQGDYVEETIRSVLLQGYPNLEYRVMDGGSSDDSAQIIGRYAAYLNGWVSEPDDGQADAIYRGFEASTGELLAWVNSDDILLPGAVQALASVFLRRAQTELVVGGVVFIDEQSRVMHKNGAPWFHMGTRVTLPKLLLWQSGFYQPASMWRRQAFFAAGGFDRSLFFSFDYDMVMRLARRRAGRRLNRIVAGYRRHADAKTTVSRQTMLRENQTLYERHGRDAYPRLIQRVGRRYYRFMQRIDERWHFWRYRLGLLRIPFP